MKVFDFKLEFISSQGTRCYNVKKGKYIVLFNPKTQDYACSCKAYLINRKECKHIKKIKKFEEVMSIDKDFKKVFKEMV